jgi:hypothetical protein
MTTLFITRPITEQDIIRKAYDFELQAVKEDSSEPNPYFDEVKDMGLWEALNEAVYLALNKKGA